MVISLESKAVEMIAEMMPRAPVSNQTIDYMDIWDTLYETKGDRQDEVVSLNYQETVINIDQAKKIFGLEWINTNAKSLRDQMKVIISDKGEPNSIRLWYRHEVKYRELEDANDNSENVDKPFIYTTKNKLDVTIPFNKVKPYLNQ